MNRKRCPWCGKKVNYHSDSRRVNQKHTPKFFYFAKCCHCEQYYGQAVYSSKYMRAMFYLLIPTLITAFLFEIGWILFVYLILYVPSVIFIPFVRMDQDENFIQNNDIPKYEFQCTKESKIKENSLIFLTDKFDDYAAFSIGSPIYIDSFHAKSGCGSCHFLYDHPENMEVINNNYFYIFNSEMESAGRMKIMLMSALKKLQKDGNLSNPK